MKFTKLHTRKRTLLILGMLAIFVLSFSTNLVAQETFPQPTERRIALSEYRDKMMGGWIGQMVGVGWGAPTEFQSSGHIMPLEDVPEWTPEMVNVYGQDDLYVEMTFLRSMEEYGFDVSIHQAGIDFANSGYMLWHANLEGRKNLRAGIPPPNSGHPAFNSHADDIDYQIEADYSGLIAPGMPNTVIALGEKFGRLMNYGDGLYGGQFVGAMYAEAFFESDPAKLVQAGLQAIPEGSQFAEAVRDVVAWHAENPQNWEATWSLVNDKYHLNPEYRKFTCSDIESDFNIDAKINAAYIVMGMLYGEGDYDKTNIISMRCGQDSDCNPSNAAGILFTAVGYSNLPERFISGLDKNEKFSFTEYSFPALIDVCEKLAIDAVQRAGGRLELNSAGEKELVIPMVAVVPSALEQSHAPGPIADDAFTKEELSRLEGSWVFRYTTLFLLVLVFVLFRENRNFSAMMILIPLGVVFGVLEFIEMQLPESLLVMVNITSILQTMSVAMAIILLLPNKIYASKSYVCALVAALVLGAIAFGGVWGATDGRIISTTTLNLGTIALMSTAWLLGMILTTVLTKMNYRNWRFHLTMFGTFAAGQLLVWIVVAIFTMGSTKGNFFGSMVYIISATLLFAAINYVLTLPYLILAYKHTGTDNRLRNLLKIVDTQEELDVIEN